MRQIKLPTVPSGSQKPLYLFHGDDCVAIKEPGHNWKVKTVDCNKCGECCRRFLMDYDFPPIKNGKCKWLEKGGECELGRHRPLKCAIATPAFRECVVRFEEMK